MLNRSLLLSDVLLLLFFTHSAHAENWSLDFLVQHKQLSYFPDLQRTKTLFFLQFKCLKQTEKS